MIVIVIALALTGCYTEPGEPETIMMFGRYEVDMNTFTLVGTAIIIAEGGLIYVLDRLWQNRKRK